jgi:SSS family transporter
MPSQLATIDVAIVILYLAGTILLGSLFARRQRDMRSYFVGDRNVNWWLVLFSIVATETSTVTFLSVPGLAYNPDGGNLTFLQLSFGYIIGRSLIAWLLLPQYLRGDLFSAYQILRERFDVRVQRTASAIFLATRAIADGLRLYLAALLLQQFTGWSTDVSIFVIGSATIFYTLMGGIQAVIWTDLIQFVIYIAGAVLAGILMLKLLPGGWSEYWTVGEHAGKFTLIDLSGAPTARYTLWTGLIGGAFLTMASHGADQLMVQRYFCSRSLSQARAALVASGLVVLLQFLLFLLLGVGLYVLREQGILTGVTDKRNDEVFGHFIVGYLPHGVVGIVTAAVLASAMGTLSSSLSSSASAFVADFYRPVRQSLTERHYFLVSRWMTLFWGVVRMIVAVSAIRLLSNRSVVDQVLSVAGFTTGVILGLFLLGRLRRPVSTPAALFGLIAGLAVVFTVWLPAVWSEALVAWPWYAPIGTMVTVAAALIIDRFGTRHGSSADRGTKPGLHEPG